MTTVREAMSGGADCVRTDQSARDAAELMTRLGVGALPICGPDERLKGVLTDRDLVVKVLGRERNPSEFPAGDLNQDEAITAGADDTVQQAVETMGRHGVRRLPVIDGQRLVGMLTLADVARALPEAEIGRLTAVLSAP